MPVNGVALGAVSAGIVFVYAGLKGYSIPETLQALIAGKSPAGQKQAAAVPVAQEIANAAAAAAGSVTLGGSGTGSPAAAGGASAGSSAAQYQAYAFSLFGQYGWGADQRQPLIALWNQESNWNPAATNPSSGAYGIPQSLPASKMASAGADWKTNAATQIKWGLGYIKGRYGNPAGAWAHEQANNWY
jgi:hypothetical protein